MRAVIQRVSRASVVVENTEVGSIDNGLLILLGVEEHDLPGDAEWLVKKIVAMRIFQDNQDKMNLDLRETGGNLLVVSQFTLHAMTRKGNRPSFVRAAKPGQAIPLYEYFIECAEKELGKKIATGEFGAAMKVHLVNDGPVTILLDSKVKE